MHSYSAQDWLYIFLENIDKKHVSTYNISTLKANLAL